ncbi:ABC transporter ATP-binding protein [Desulforhopalus singaporensis]|uniref:Putative ABC transport system ATP-binding protein n=1 Tax=Desulforhopalus singaporensis TaxID=91360 RepID=A0A1H0M055_9BACT|nr:ABC transporter ATP-binding protein [Desulforhopalus singaporensis]SDO73724.1 putative ABC transport system ATP-binding protein [Desulforhopalus singaporensis]
MDDYILRVENLSKEFVQADRKVQVLKNLNLSVLSGEFVVIAGKSGSGKSTLLSILSGLEQPTGGSVVFQGQNIGILSEDQLAPIRNRKIGFVFQAFHLIPSLNALENIMFPAELKKDGNARDKAMKLLERVGLSQRAVNFPFQLSGGEQQRVAICRALINNPAIIYADEPTGNLDSDNSAAVIKLLDELHRDRKTTLVVATHSHSLADKAGRVIRLHDGRIVDGGGR